MNWKKVAWRVAMVTLFAIAAFGIYHAFGDTFHKLALTDFTKWRPAPLPLAIAVVMAVGVNILHAVLWRRISVDLGSPAPNARATLHIYFVSGLSKYIVKLGQMPGLAVLASKFGMAAGRATTAALLGQLIFLITGFLFVSATMPSIRAQYPGLPVDPVWVGLAMAAATIVGTWIIVGTRTGLAVRSAIVKRTGGRTSERLASAFSMIDEARPKDAVLWATGYAVSWIILSLGFLSFTIAFYPPAAHSARYVAGVAAATFVLGNFSPLQAGLGREIAMAALLKAIMPGPGAFVVAILSRFWFMSGELLPLLLIPLLGQPTVSATVPKAAAP